MEFVIVGAGGHASDILAVAEAAEPGGHAVVGIVSDYAPDNLRRFEERGAPYLGGLEALSELPPHIGYIIGIGYPMPRQELALRVQMEHRPVVTLVHPRAILGELVTVGRGCVIMANAHVSPLSRLEDHVHISYLAAVGHDTIVGEFSAVFPGAMISGNVKVGRGVMVGSNATIKEKLQIGDYAVIGAGAVVTKDVPDGATVRGIPAR